MTETLTNALQALYAAEDRIMNSSEQSGLGYVRDARQAIERELRDTEEAVGRRDQ